MSVTLSSGDHPPSYDEVIQSPAFGHLNMVSGRMGIYQWYTINWRYIYLMYSKLEMKNLCVQIWLVGYKDIYT